MLVLSRKRQQSVVVGNANDAQSPITITILEIHGKRVRLGIDAARKLPIQRGEVWARINGTDSPPTGTALRSA